ncbi:MAG: HAD-IA family hydrolase [Planctomycetota bacterium]
MILDGLIFNLDGTLAETLPVCIEAYRNTIEEFLGKRYSDHEIHGFLGYSEEGVFEQLVPEHWQACVAAYQEYYDRAHAGLREPFAGLERVFELLESKGIKVAIATSKGAGSAAVSIRNLGLAKYFDYVESGSATGNSKMKSLRRVINKWNVAPAFAAYLGDSVSDVAAARMAGVQALAAAWSEYADPVALASAKPREVFRSVDELYQWIEKRVQGPGLEY